jgi:CRP-like cAMP-binding protein
VQIAFQSGVARLAVSFDEQFPDVTLAFCGDQEAQWLRLPQGVVLLLEAVSECTLRLGYAEQCPVHQDLLLHWLMGLHLVRHPVGAEARLIALFQLLVIHFGIRRADGYLLPFSLSHSRLAELIGTTRSTVTRQINVLRRQGDLNLDQSQGLLLAATLIEHQPIPNLH